MTTMYKFWLHIQQYSAIYLWLCMYTTEGGQPWPKDVMFNIINWLTYWYTQFNRLLYITEWTRCVMAYKTLNLFIQQVTKHKPWKKPFLYLILNIILLLFYFLYIHLSKGTELNYYYYGMWIQELFACISFSINWGEIEVYIKIRCCKLKIFWNLFSNHRIRFSLMIDSFHTVFRR